MKGPEGCMNGLDGWRECKCDSIPGKRPPMYADIHERVQTKASRNSVTRDADAGIAVITKGSSPLRRWWGRTVPEAERLVHCRESVMGCWVI